MAKVLIVDDSLLIRKYLKGILEKAGFETELAQNGQECLEKIPTFNPDVITLDINMPVMDGITCLKQIMSKFPKPVLMVSSLTYKGASSTFRALELGAVDYISKPQSAVSQNNPSEAELLVRKVVSASKSHISFNARLRQTGKSKIENQPPLFVKRALQNDASQIEAIVIGVSTGGPSCLQVILENIPATFPVPIVIAQHMPARFTEVFSQRLDKLCELNVLEVTSLTELKSGHVYLAKGDADIEFLRKNNRLMVRSLPSDKNYLWHPSVSKLVDTAVSQINPKKLICVQLTGMGNDGANAMHNAHQLGAYCIAESEETAVVYGMPKELVTLGSANVVLPNYKIANAIMEKI